MAARVLAADYDGTLAEHGELAAATAGELERLRAAGWQLVLVTGRQLDDLRSVCPRLDLFAAVVAENGALLHRPASGESRPLAPPPPDDFVAALRRRGVAPLAVGAVIVATLLPHLQTVRQTIAELRLPLAIVLNRDAVMVLPAAVDKGSGLTQTLAILGLDDAEIVALGDAENDLPLFRACRFAIAVGNALPEVRAAAHLVTVGAAGAGAREAIGRLLAR
jgi:hydroxymethylpyrimidine pyrophosphatase-like HAD family hydrolase